MEELYIVILHLISHLIVSVTFNNNAASNGGVVYCEDSSIITFDGNSSVTFKNNKANEDGGAMHLSNMAAFTTQWWYNVTFYNSTAIHNGGALHLDSKSTAVFKGNSATLLEDNKATLNVGVVYSIDSCSITFDEYSNTMLCNNDAIYLGGGLYSLKKVWLNFAGHSQITFYHNEAANSVVAMFIDDYSNATLTEHSKVIYFNNKAIYSGGAVYCDGQSMISSDWNTSLHFINNTADNGGAVFTMQSSLNISSVNFTNNIVTESGGAIHITNSFTAIFQDNSHITFSHNIANRYGGAIFAKFTHSFQSKIIFKTEINFSDNAALRGPKVYADIPTSCNDTCLQNSIVGSNSNSFINDAVRSYIDTPPEKLEFYKSAICIENNTNGNCQTYLTRNIMLGQEIIIDACVLDYYNQPADGTLFF